jgi:hypothetical protein
MSATYAGARWPPPQVKRSTGILPVGQPGRLAWLKAVPGRQDACRPPQPGWLCSPLDAVGSVQRRLRWSGRCGMLVIARGTFRVRFGGPFGSPPGFHRRRKLSATFRRKIELFFRFLDSSRFLRLASLRRLGSCASGASSRFSRGFQLPCCFRRL